MNGLQMAAAYAMKPNELGRCGPSGAHQILFRFVAQDEGTEEEIRTVLRQFPVAMPYYQIIARANGIADPFDQAVVEAYWLGNELLERVALRDVAQLIRDDLAREGWSKEQLAWTFSALRLTKARPHHGLTVLYFYNRQLKNIELPETVKIDLRQRVNQCRVSAGVVIESNQSQIVVEYEPLVFGEKRIVLGPRQKLTVQRGFLSEVAVGAVVSFHLGWGVQVLTNQQKLNLKEYTQLSLMAVNC